MEPKSQVVAPVIGRNSLRSSQQIHLYIIDVVNIYVYYFMSFYILLLCILDDLRFSRDTKQQPGICHSFSKVHHLELACLVTSGSDVVSRSNTH